MRRAREQRTSPSSTKTAVGRNHSGFKQYHLNIGTDGSGRSLAPFFHASPGNPNWRKASNPMAATAFDKLRERAPGRMGNRMRSPG